MEITKQDFDAVSSRLTVNVAEGDYKEKVNEELKKIGKTHNIPGFRKGHVPASQLNRMFGKQVTSDIINRVVYDAVFKYLQDNKLNVLGEPVPVEVKELDLVNQKDFTFEYDLALAPALDIKLDKDVKLEYVKIAVSDEMLNEQDTALRKRFGAQVPGEEVEADALQVVNEIVAPAYFKSKEEADKFIGKKVGDKIVFNPSATCDGDAAELSSMLQIDKERATGVKGDFQLVISEIIVVRPAELGEEYYTNVFGKDKVNNEEEYREALKAMISAQLSGNSEALFRIDTQKYLVDKYGDMQLPVTVLKRWLVNRNEELTDENIDAEYVKIEPDLKWQLIKERVAELANVKIEDEDLRSYAKNIAAQQFAQYGMTNMPDETIAKYAENILADRNYRSRLVQEVGDIKLFDAIKNLVTLEVKEVSLDEFKKIAEAK